MLPSFSLNISLKVEESTEVLGITTVCSWRLAIELPTKTGELLLRARACLNDKGVGEEERIREGRNTQPLGYLAQTNNQPQPALGVAVRNNLHSSQVTHSLRDGGGHQGSIIEA